MPVPGTRGRRSRVAAGGVSNGKQVNVFSVRRRGSLALRKYAHWSFDEGRCSDRR